MSRRSPATVAAMDRLHAALVDLDAPLTANEAREAAGGTILYPEAARYLKMLAADGLAIRVSLAFEGTGIRWVARQRLTPIAELEEAFRL